MSTRKPKSSRRCLITPDSTPREGYLARTRACRKANPRPSMRLASAKVQSIAMPPASPPVAGITCGVCAASRPLATRGRSAGDIILRPGAVPIVMGLERAVGHLSTPSAVVQIPYPLHSETRGQDVRARTVEFWRSVATSVKRAHGSSKGCWANSLRMVAGTAKQSVAPCAPHSTAPSASSKGCLNMSRPTVPPLR